MNRLLFVYPFTGWWTLVLTFWLLWILLLWTFCYKVFLEHLFLFFRKRVESGLLSYMVILFNSLRNGHFFFLYELLNYTCKLMWEGAPSFFMWKVSLWGRCRAIFDVLGHLGSSLRFEAQGVQVHAAFFPEQEVACPEGREGRHLRSEAWDSKSIWRR